MNLENAYVHMVNNPRGNIYYSGISHINS
jgi:hypothetical protein